MILPSFIVNLIPHFLLRLCIKHNTFLVKCIFEIWLSIGIIFNKNLDFENIVLVSLL